MPLRPVKHDPFRVELHVVRHGSTALNGQDGGVDRIRGWKDVPLSPKGRLEAAGAGKKLAGSGIELLVHSDLSRARDTSNAIARSTGAKEIASSALRPWNLGEFTGKESAAIQPELRKYVVDEPGKAVPGGESFDDFKRRVFAGIADAIDRAAGRKLGLVTHHRVERLIEAWIAKGQPADLSIEADVMFRHGDAPASHKLVTIELERLPERRDAMPASATSTTPPPGSPQEPGRGA